MPAPQNLRKRLGLFWTLLVWVPMISSAQTADPQVTLEAGQVQYKVETGVLEFAFTLVNSTDSVVFLDCQVPPKFSLQGKQLLLTLARVPQAADMDAFPPQRIGARQTFQGQRRFDHILGEAEARPEFSTMQLEIAWYPERAEGAGPLFVVERGATVTAKPVSVSRTGKIAPPPRKTKIVKPIEP